MSNTDRWMDGWMVDIGGWMDGWMEGGMDGWIEDAWMDGWVDKWVKASRLMKGRMYITETSLSPWWHHRTPRAELSQEAC